MSLLDVQTASPSACNFYPTASINQQPITKTHTPTFRSVWTHDEWPPQRHACCTSLAWVQIWWNMTSLLALWQSGLPKQGCVLIPWQAVSNSKPNSPYLSMSSALTLSFRRENNCTLCIHFHLIAGLWLIYPK